MELKDKLISSFLAFEEGLDSDNTLYNVRNRAIKDFEALGFPNRKEEDWKYTSLNPVLKQDYSVFPKKEDAIDYRDIKKYFIHDIDTYDLVFVDGIYSSHLSQTTHDKIDVCLMSSALNKDKYRPVIENYFSKVAPKTGLNSLNTAFAREGAFIHIHKNRQANKPIQIINFSTGNEPSLLLQPRNLIVVDENSQVQVIERHQSLTDHPVLTNSVTEIFAEKRAIVDYYKIQNDKSSASLIDNTFIEQKDESNVSVHTFSFGGKLTRNNLQFFQKGERINSILKGVTIIEDKQHVDHNTLVHHIEPNCESHQDYKGIYGDRSTGVFNGRVIVEKEAQKTNAYQSNNNILADDKATINSKPQLEIFADDVRCSHGCTIGQLDEDALFYLQSRGIPRKEARGLLMYAFANNVLESVKIPEVKKRINKLIATKLEVDLGFNL
ncbi:Fe-S cluster assembly protein SufD [Christiangramia fulva]|uniref:Fe-S cluster assembly protein SufD n=1 Tax=Christiangramia fulva TaxID=2126553 RepID=A0A2R3Z3Y8_9FLAO|nr:Fe-S cluster assembly protein SufD [Christiangramia fulva]AVR44993.1 Fe-S cluster assembly protein SufD [Christiangramia fulva]